jgi:transposase
MSRRCKLEVTAEQEEQLRCLARSNRRDQADRARALLMSKDGKTSPQIAAVLGVRPEQIRRWRTRFREGGPEALKTRPRSGRPDTKAQAALSVAHEVLETEETEVLWTLPRLAAEVQRRTGVSIAPAHLSVVLRKKGATQGSDPATASRSGRTKTR